MIAQLMIFCFKRCKHLNQNKVPATTVHWGIVCLYMTKMIKLNVLCGAIIIMFHIIIIIIIIIIITLLHKLTLSYLMQANLTISPMGCPLAHLLKILGLAFWWLLILPSWLHCGQKWSHMGMAGPSNGFAVEGGWRKIWMVEILTSLVLVEILSIKFLILMFYMLFWLQIITCALINTNRWNSKFKMVFY